VCPSQRTVEALKARVIQLPIIDMFESLFGSKQSPLCLFLTWKACQEFSIADEFRFYSVPKDWQCRVCQELGLQFMNVMLVVHKLDIRIQCAQLVYWYTLYICL